MNKKFLKIFIILFISNSLYAQFTQSENILSAKIIFPAEQLARQTSYPVLIKIDIKQKLDLLPEVTIEANVQQPLSLYGKR